MHSARTGADPLAAPAVTLETAPTAPDIVPTARGPVPVDELGLTLPHEHLFVLSAEFQANYRLWDRDRGVAAAVAQLRQAYDKGVRTIVDLTVLGQGRDIGLVAQVAAATPVNLILATGVYSVDGIPLFARFRGPGCAIEDEEPLLDLLLHDITDGIGGTDVRAALVKFACEDSPAGAAAGRMAAVVAEVHRRTGVPVVIHSNPANGNGLELLRLVTREGVPAERVVVGHAGDCADRTYLRRLAETGCYLGYDRFGMVTFAPDELRCSTLAELVRAGHLKQLLISQDNASHIDYLTEAQRARLYPDWGYTHIIDRILPRLAQEHGLGDEELETLMHSNPHRMVAPAVRAVAQAGR